MRASSLVQCYQYEHYLEAATEAHLAAHGVSDVLARGDQRVARDTRVSVALSITEAPSGTQDEIPLPSGGSSIEYVRRTGTLEIHVVTERRKDIPVGGAPRLHADILAHVRVAFMSAFMDEFNERLPFHAIALPPRDAGCEYQQDAEHGLDITIQRFAVVIDHRPDSWPIDTTAP